MTPDDLRAIRDELIAGPHFGTEIRQRRAALVAAVETELHRLGEPLAVVPAKSPQAPPLVGPPCQAHRPHVIPTLILSCHLAAGHRGAHRDSSAALWWTHDYTGAAAPPPTLSPVPTTEPTLPPVAGSEEGRRLRDRAVGIARAFAAGRAS